MAFKARAVAIGNSDTVIYECPPALEAAGKLMFSNPTGTPRTLTVKFFDASAGSATTVISRQVAANSDYALPIPPSAEQGDRFIAAGDQAGLVAQYTITQSDLSPSAKGFNPMGDYAAGTAYAMGDVVTSGGTSYVSRIDGNAGNLPSISPEYWQVIASKGDNGTPGADGVNGQDGEDGEGNVNGPASAVNGRFPAFDGASGKILKDSGFSDASFATAAQGAKADTALQPGTTALDSRYYTEAEVDAAISAAVAAAVAGVSKRSTVRVATTGNVTISSALNAGDTLNGVTLANNDRVLVKNQTAPAENGVYVVGPSPARDVLFDTFDELAGSVLVVQEGSTDGDTVWFCTSNAGGAIGTTAVNFTKLTVAGELLAANNLSDLPNPATARSNLGLGSVDNVPAASLRDRSTHTGTQAAGTITGLATVATSGAYDDLSGQPTLGNVAGMNEATAAQLRSRAAAAPISPDIVSQAKNAVSLAYSATRSLVWTDGWFRTCTLTGNMVVSNPTGIDVGDTIMLLLVANSATERTVSWGTYYKGNLPTETVTSTRKLLVSLTAASTTEIVVSYVVIA